MTCHLFDGSCQDCEEEYCQDTIDEIRYDYKIEIDKIHKIEEQIEAHFIKIDTIKAGLRSDTNEHRAIVFDIYSKNKELIDSS